MCVRLNGIPPQVWIVKVFRFGFIFSAKQVLFLFLSFFFFSGKKLLFFLFVKKQIFLSFSKPLYFCRLDLFRNFTKCHDQVTKEKKTKRSRQPGKNPFFSLSLELLSYWLPVLDTKKNHLGRDTRHKTHRQHNTTL